MAKGKVLKSGDRAYGKYQILGSNIPSWSKEALGRVYTISEFLESPEAQDLIAQYKIDEYLKWYSQEDAISMWFSGKPLSKAGNLQDVNGTTGSGYVNQVEGLIE